MSPPSGRGSPETLTCRACGAELRPGTKFCRRCGTQVPEVQQPAASDGQPTVEVRPRPADVRQQPGPPPQRAKRRLPSAALITLAVLLLLAAGATAFALTRHDSHVSAKVAARTHRLQTKSTAGASGSGRANHGRAATGGTATSATASPQVGDSSGTSSSSASTKTTAPAVTSTSTSTAAATATTASSSDPLGAVQSYWNSIAAHNFAAAYGDLAPGAARKTEADFVTAEQQFGIQSVQFVGHVSSQSGSQATVTVDSLMTTDAKVGCQTWTGTYTLGQQGGKWLIQQANLTPSPCGN